MARAGTITLLVGALASCSKRTPPPTRDLTAAVAKPIAPAAQTSTAATQASVGGDGKLDPNDPKHGTRRLMGLDTGVFVDGVQVAVLRYGDLPVIPAETLEGGSKRYRLYDYLKAIGVAPETVKSVHLHGNGDRIGSIEGAELVKDKARFAFQFASGTTGAPLQRWDTGGLKNPFVVHEFRRVTIYVKKPVPAIDKDRQCHVGEDGQCSEATPYAEGDAVKGTRVYLDGKMVGFVKRRQLSDQTLLETLPSGEQTYGVERLAKQFHVDTKGINAVEFVAGDDVVGRANADQWSKLGASLYFVLPRHNHGKIRIHVPTEFQSTEAPAGDRDALVSSVIFYRRTKPSAERELTTISEDTDLSVQLATNEPAQPGLDRRER